MPKQLINVVGGLIAAAVLVLAVLIGVLPQVSAATATDGQTSQIAGTNALYDAQIAALKKAKETLPQTQQIVEALHKQIPDVPKLDQVFELVAKAADKSHVTIVGISVGDPVTFVPVGSKDDGKTVAQSGQPAATPTPSPTSTPGAETNGSTGGAGAAAGTGRLQIPISIDASAPDVKSAVAMLDALHAGPRLLANAASTLTAGAEAFDIHIDAFTFVADATSAGAAK